jgi:hypothetical protein
VYNNIYKRTIIVVFELLWPFPNGVVPSIVFIICDLQKTLIISIIILNSKLRDFIKSYSKGAVASFFLEVFLHLDVVLTYLVDKVGNKKLHPTKT